MRVNQIDCPKCGTSLKSAAGVPVGKSLACPKCRHKFTVQVPDDADVIDDADVVDDDRPSPRKKGPPPPPAVARRRSTVRDDDDEEDDDDEPRPKKRRPEGRKRPREDDEEDEDRPRKKKIRRVEEEEELSLYRRLRNNIAVRIITWVVLLTILAVSAYLLYRKQIDQAESERGSLNSPNYAFSLPVGLDRGVDVG
jgi:hypothetical protein